MLLLNSTQTGAPCQACDQATLATALTQDTNNADNQAAATAEIVRVNAQAIQIFGPGEAKYELKKRLGSEGILDNIGSVEDTDRLTDRQVAKRVRERFPARAYINIF